MKNNANSKCLQGIERPVLVTLKTIPAWHEIAGSKLTDWGMAGDLALLSKLFPSPSRPARLTLDERGRGVILRSGYRLPAHWFQVERIDEKIEGNVELIEILIDEMQQLVPSLLVAGTDELDDILGPIEDRACGIISSCRSLQMLFVRQVLLDKDCASDADGGEEK